MINTYFESDVISGKSFDRKIIKFLWKYLRRYRAIFIFSIFLSLVTTGLVILIPYLTATVIDRGIEKGLESIVIKIGMALLIVQVVYFISLSLQMYLMQFIGARVVNDLRIDVFRLIQRLKISYFDKNPVGRVVTRLTNDMTAIGDVFSEGAIMVLFNFVFIIGAMAFIIILDWKLGLLSLSTFPFMCFIGYKVAILLRESKRIVREKLAVINAFLSEHIAGMKVVNIFSKEEEALKKFKDANDSHMSYTIRQMKLYATLMPTVTIMTGISISLIIWYGGSEVFRENLTIGLMVAFIRYIEWILEPLRNIIERYNIFLQSSTATERIYKISLLEEENSPEEISTFEEMRGDVEFKNVCFKYDEKEEKNILKDVNFKIKSGERIAFVGETGSGKTTILNLINKFYTPGSGEILLDGKNIRDVERKNLRNFIGKIDQNVHIFSGTIRENITLGREISDEALVKSLALSNCYKIVNRYERGIDHIVTEGGKNLSFGERQLIAFARMVAYDPSIVILDEATSNIDSENEKYIIEATRKITEGKTSIIVAHRLSTVISSDRIYVVDKGEIVEAGTHDDLLANGKKYSSLYRAMIINE